ncbi:MAG: phage terminase large subunit [Candidatus Kapaibacterium sp.]
MFCAGAGGPITGRGADLLIIDDPVKNDAAANSFNQRNKLWEWFRATAFTRLEPGGALILVMTRWHEDDLTGRLERSGMINKSGWKHILLPALAQPEDPLGRLPGDALWPERYGIKELAEIRDSIGSVWFNALYQQSPMASSGRVFKTECFREFTMDSLYYYLRKNSDVSKEFIRNCSVMAAADLAARISETADYTVLIVFAVTPSRDILLLDLIRSRFEGADHIGLLERVNRRWNPSLIGIESVQYQISLVQQAMRRGLPVTELRPEKDKVSRALAAAARLEAGMIYLPEKCAFSDELIAELRAFPDGEHDDIADAFSYAVRMAAPLRRGRPAGTGRTNTLTEGYRLF